MPAWVQRWLEKPWVAHLLRANERFNGRLGLQFTAAITYFSVLAIVPLLMVALSVLGFVLFVSRPDLIPVLAEQLASLLSGVDADTQRNVQTFVLERLQNWATIGLVGLVAALYSGAGWMGNLRDALDAQFRHDFDADRAQPNVVTKTLSSLVYLLGLLVAIILTFGLSSISTALSDQVIALLGLRNTPGLSLLFSLLPVLFSLAAGWLTFCYIFRFLPEERQPGRAIAKGAIGGAVGLAVLQYLTSFLISIFAGNQAVQLFGPVIILMLFFNLFARLILMIAAWIATTDEPAFPSRENDVRFAIAPEGSVEAQPEEPELVAAERVVADRVVSERVATHTVRIGLGAGYLTGAATGAGLGAIIAVVAGWLGRRRR